MKINDSGYAEIKPHTLAKMKEGICQLVLNRNKGTRILITYRPENSSGDKVETGRPERVRVLARYFVRSTSAPVLESRNTWWEIGFIPSPNDTKPPLLPTLDDKTAFGNAIEEPVRKLFEDKVINFAGRKMQPKSSASVGGADVVWKELAELYAELGRELRDPLYAELALELSG